MYNISSLTFFFYKGGGGALLYTKPGNPLYYPEIWIFYVELIATSPGHLCVTWLLHRFTLESVDSDFFFLGGGGGGGKNPQPKEIRARNLNEFK